MFRNPAIEVILFIVMAGHKLLMETRMLLNSPFDEDLMYRFNDLSSHSCEVMPKRRGSVPVGTMGETFGYTISIR